MAPIDALQQHRQLRTRQANGAFRRLRPYESASLQTLGKKTKTVAIEPKAFNNVTSSAAENEDVTREWLLVKNGLYLSAESIEVG